MSDGVEKQLVKSRKRSLKSDLTKSASKRRSQESEGVSVSDHADEVVDKDKNDTCSSTGSSSVLASGDSACVDPSNGTKLTLEFYDRPCEQLAKELLGKRLVRILDSGERVSGTIVETESYLGGEDHASHSFNGKKTPRNEPMFMAPGTSYVYHIYGMYTCFNISSRGDGAAVLIRGLDPTEGLATMRTLRGAKRTDRGTKLKIKELCNGPSKLTQALHISKDAINKLDLPTSAVIWLEEGEAVPAEQIVESPRIGIKCAEEWVKAPLRFYTLKRPGVSVIDKAAERLMTATAAGSAD